MQATIPDRALSTYFFIFITELLLYDQTFHYE